jgi:hypothetical protein
MTRTSRKYRTCDTIAQRPGRKHRTHSRGKAQYERVLLTLLNEAIRGIKNISTGKTLSLKKLKVRYGR